MYTSHVAPLVTTHTCSFASQSPSSTLSSPCNVKALKFPLPALVALKSESSSNLSKKRGGGRATEIPIVAELYTAGREISS